MKKGLLKRSVAILLFSAILACLGASNAFARTSSAGTAWDIIIKIENFNETLDIVDGFFETADGQPGQSPTAMIRGMLQGGEWLDPDRTIVVGAIMGEPQPTAVALVPFRQPNETFRNMMNASSGPGYYLMSLPPGQPALFSAEQESSLVATSKMKGGRAISLEFFVNRLLKKSEKQIAETMLNLQTMQPGTQQGAPDFTPEETRAILTDMLNAASQVESLLIGLDLEPETVSASMEALAVKGTKLADLFSPDTAKTMFNGYDPSHQINFKMARFDLTGTVDFFDRVFGKAYQKMGIDFRQLASITEHFTGESAGGMNYDAGGASFESIVVMTKPRKSPEFLESVYIPWLKDYCDNLRKFMETNTGRKPEPIFRRTEDTVVSGYKTVGVDLHVPFAIAGPHAGNNASSDFEPFVYRFRMTIVDDLFLTAPDDDRLAELIEKAKKLDPAPLKGPLGEFEIDMTSYFDVLKDSVPGLKASGPTPDLGKIGYACDMADGKLSADSTMKVKDIKNIVEYFKALAPDDGSFAGPDGNEELSFHAEPKPLVSAEPVRVGAEDPEKNARAQRKVDRPVAKDFDYWMDRGGLVSAYGNDAAAVEYYKKAIALDPSRDEAYYGLGVALGQEERFAESLNALNRAIAMNSGKAAYYYARGRVYLLAGQRDASLVDMVKAAEMGDQDARDYLEKNREIR